MKTCFAQIFLTAEWRNLAMLNYEIDPIILKPLVPRGTELDFHNDQTLISVVGFLFQKTRIYSLPILFHTNFEEVNLRFYVRRKASDGWRRGVVFIKELVPRRMIAFIARQYYNENYIAVPMSHQIERLDENIKSIAYSWQFDGNENHLKLTARGNAQSLVEGSAQEFITEHYWGYTTQRDGSTLEYHVEHPRWRVWEAQHSELHCGVAKLYGEIFLDSLSRPPSSAFLAEGSKVKVYRGLKL